MIRLNTLPASVRSAAILALVLGAGSNTITTRRGTAVAQDTATKPWMDRSLSSDERANLLLQQMTLDEKLSLLHGNGMAREPQWQRPLTRDSNGGAGYITPIPRLGIPAVDISDAAYGVRAAGAMGRYATALPSDLAAACSWDRHAAYEYGALIAQELRTQGFNMSLGGGINLTREPRDGRTFEYLGEDPVLAGTLVGQLMAAEKAEHVISSIKHYAVNDQETGRDIVSANISKRAMRESDLFAFQIGIRDAQPGAVMCAYNGVNHQYACENDYLLREVLKGEWRFPGFVVSDWGATHSSVQASHAGLDHEEPLDDFFGSALKAAVEQKQVPLAEIDDHARRILRSYFDDGVMDYPVSRRVIDVERHLDVAQQMEERSIVLLKNEHSILPLDAAHTRSLAVVGAHADVGMLSGGGSAQVDPPGGNAINPAEGAISFQTHSHVFFPTSPLKQLRAMLPNTKVEFASGDDLAAAAALVRQSDFAIVFVQQWEMEGMDLPSLALPGNQDALVEAVAAANPHSIVVLETGTAALMPWAGKVQGIVEAWYGGSRGATALARVLTGVVNPSGKLAITFPLRDADLPHPVIPPLPAADIGAGAAAVSAGADTHSNYSVNYDEGVEVGYKWYDAKEKPVLFPFGFGLSYTTFAYSDLHVSGGTKPQVRFTVKNTGARSGAEVAELYAILPLTTKEPPKRLIGYDKFTLAPGESRQVTIDVDPLFLTVYDEQERRMQVVPGRYSFAVGGSSQSLPLEQQVDLPGQLL